jgi:hypothetical protein
MISEAPAEPSYWISRNLVGVPEEQITGFTSEMLDTAV